MVCLCLFGGQTHGQADEQLARSSFSESRPSVERVKEGWKHQLYAGGILLMVCECKQPSNTRAQSDTK